MTLHPLALFTALRKRAHLPTLLLLLVALAINLNNALKHFSDPMMFDAQNVYLPYAHALLQEKFSFLLDIRSLHVAPMSYIYPAIFGADPNAIKIGNVVLSCLSVLIMFRLGMLLHSRPAGLAAAFLYAASSILTEYKPVILSEAPFLFLTAAWMLAVAEIVCGRKAYIVPAGIACGLMILTRGTYIYFLYATIAITLYLSLRGGMQQTGRWLFLAHLLALLFPVAIIVKNWLAFGYPGLATGVGAALYFGSHPLTEGYEAPYLHLGYDIGAVTHELDYLSIEGDKLLKGVAILMLKQQPLAHLLAIYAKKMFAFVFVTKAILPDTLWNFRSLRIAEVLLALPGLYYLRPRLMAWFLGGALSYQVLVHVPVLYNHRYSVGAVEIPLILLSTIGATQLLMDFGKRRWLRPAIAVVAIFLSIGVGELHRRYSQVLMPDILAVPHVDVLQRSAHELSGLNGNGIVKKDGTAYRNTEESWSLDIPIPELSLSRHEEYYVYSIDMAVNTEESGHRCGMGAIYFRSQDETFSEAHSLPFHIESDGQPHEYFFSATYGLSPVFPLAAGILRVSGHCPVGSQINLDDFRISYSRIGQEYRQRYLEQNQ